MPHPFLSEENKNLKAFVLGGLLAATFTQPAPDKLFTMGFLSRFRRSGLLDEDSLTMLEEALEEPEVQSQILFFLTFVGMLLSLRILTSRDTKTLSGEHVLNMHNLNDAILIKEVVLSFLNAAILDPVLAIGSLENDSSDFWIKLMTNIFELMSLCWWIFVITDAFDYNDVMFQYKFHYEFRPEIEGDPKKFSFIRLRDKHAESRSERRAFLGNVGRDVALWFSLGAIATAWLPGAVEHKDVLHAYVVVVMWLVLHHYLRRATCWGINWFYTFLFPSTALMPMEYCMSLTDTADVVEDGEFVAVYREFVHDRTGVELIIET